MSCALTTGYTLGCRDSVGGIKAIYVQNWISTGSCNTNLSGAVTGFAVNAALSKIILDKSTFIAPSVTAFYTRPFQITRRLTISPELYVMSNPIMYSTKENVTLVDRSVGFFGGSGFDFQLSKKFKVNFNYKINASTKSDFPVLNFFLIGSKVNL